MRTALIHDWISDRPGGGERVLVALHELLPEAVLHVLVGHEDKMRDLGFDPAEVRQSFLGRWPGSRHYYRNLLPLFPLAVESLDLSDYDLIVSNSSSVAKGVLVNAEQRHVCYCLTPMRYAWDLTHRYLREHRLGWGPLGLFARLSLHYVRQWDSAAASRVDRFVAISHFTARRVWRTYGRRAEVVYPPVEVARFAPGGPRDDHFLFVSRLVPYKQGPLVVRAFNALGLPLVVVGGGPELARVRALAGPTVKVISDADDRTVADLMSRARAFIFAAEEDFGIVPVEAQAAGTPVIAYGRGGACETVVPATGDNWDEATGVYFERQTEDALIDAVRRFIADEARFNADACRRNAERFSRERFDAEFRAVLDSPEEDDGPMNALAAPAARALPSARR